MSVSIPTVDPTSLSIAGANARFPIRRVFCVGRNYADHAREMGHDPNKEPPFFFMKPADAVVEAPTELTFPRATDDLHHEIELVVALASGGDDVPVARALDCVFGYGVGLDMTRRDLQSEAKKLGRPWDMAKGFDLSAPMSQLHRVEEVGHLDTGVIELAVNGQGRQHGDLNQQIWNVQETIAYLSTLVTLKGGDLIMTGTPSGVGKVVAGDALVGRIAGLDEVRVTYVDSRLGS